MINKLLNEYSLELNFSSSFYVIQSIFLLFPVFWMPFRWPAKSFPKEVFVLGLNLFVPLFSFAGCKVPTLKSYSLDDFDQRSKGDEAWGFQQSDYILWDILFCGVLCITSFSFIIDSSIQYYSFVLGVFREIKNDTCMPGEGWQRLLAFQQNPLSLW